MQMHMDQTVNASVYDRALCEIASSIVSGVKGDCKNGTFEQIRKGFFSERRGKRAGILHTDADIGISQNHEKGSLDYELADATLYNKNFDCKREKL